MSTLCRVDNVYVGSVFVRRLQIVSFLGSIALFLASIEYLIPKPLPFFRIGLANLPILFALRYLRTRDIILLVLLKVVGQGLVNGTLLSYVFLFSFSGSFVSLFVMLGLSYLPPRWLGLVGISMAGALCSNVIQMVFSVYIIFGEAAWGMFLVFIIFGCISGAVLGYVAERYAHRSKWVALIRSDYVKGS